MDCIFTMEDHLLDLTPVENIGGMWWKREDKFAPLGYGGINGSKLRQLSGCAVTSITPVLRQAR